MFVCFPSLYLSFGLSEDDAYVDKLPTFERHFDSLAGTVNQHDGEKEGDGVGKWGVRSVLCHLFETLYPECTWHRRVKAISECF